MFSNMFFRYTWRTHQLWRFIYHVKFIIQYTFPDIFSFFFKFILVFIQFFFPWQQIYSCNFQFPNELSETIDFVIIYVFKVFATMKLNLKSTRDVFIKKTYKFLITTIKDTSRPGVDPELQYKQGLSLIHIWRCRRYSLCRSRWSPYH